MTRHRTFGPPVLLLLASLAMPASAQHERREENPRPERPREGRASERAPERGAERGREQHSPTRAAPQDPRPMRDMERSRPVPGPERQARPERQDRQERPGRPEGRMARGEPRGTMSSPPDRAPSRPQGRETRPAPHAAETARAWQSRDTWRRDAWPAHSNWREHRAQHWERDHRTWAQRGGYGGYRIPEPQFISRFGNGHPFRLGSRPVIYQGYPRFRCGGYWFLMVDPWPEFWVDNWYLTDEVYIDYYGDGYYLVNPRHPGIRVAITVFL